MLTDGQWAYALEGTYGTLASPDRYIETLSDGTAPDWDPQPWQGRGLRAAAGFPVASRRRAGYGQGAPTVKYEVPTRGGLELLSALLGSGTVTKVGAPESTTYQFLGSTALSDNILPSITAQYGIPDAAAAGEAVNPITFAGCTCSQLEIECSGAADPLTISATLDALSRDDTESLATWAATASQDWFFGWSGSVMLGTSITPPTATALASGGSELAAVRSWKVTLDQGIKTDGWIVGGRRQPRIQGRSVTLEAEIAFDDTDLVEAARDQTALGIILTSEAGSLSTGLETFQVCLPCWYLDDAALPEWSAEGDEPSIKVKATCLIDDGATPDTEPLYIAQRTADSAL